MMSKEVVSAGSETLYSIYPAVPMISWTDHMRNEKALLRVEEQGNILHEINKRKDNWLVTFCVETAFYNGLLKGR
jgi:hypothetical protein